MVSCAGRHRSYRNEIQKYVSGKSDPLTENLQNFATKLFMRPIIHVFPATFVEIGNAEVTKPVHGICDEKIIEKVSFVPFLRRPGSDVAENFIRSLFPHSPSLCQVSSKSAQFSERYTRKCVLRPLQYRREACSLLADNNFIRRQ